MRTKMMRGAIMATSLSLGLFVVGRADAAFTVTFSQVGNNVVSTGIGSLDVADLSFNSSNNTFGQVNPSFTALVVGASGAVSLYNAFFSNSTKIGTGTQTLANTGTGNIAGFSLGGAVLVSSTYTSGSSFTSTNTYLNQSFASLGLTAGTYTYAYSASQRGATVDTITVQIGPASVPEPSSLVLCGIAGLAGLGVAPVRRRHI